MTAEQVGRILTCLFIAATVWAVAKWISIPGALGYMTYLLLRPSKPEEKPK